MKENVFFILVDCLRADKCYGDNRTAKTPNIDVLIKKGTFFSKVIATTTTTTPSVASLFTGLYTFSHGIRSLKGYKLANNIKTLAEIFKENGYNTYAEVTGPLVSAPGLDKGFDIYTHRNIKELFIGNWGDSLIEKFKNGYFKDPWFIFIHLWELHEPRFIANGFNNKKYGKNKYERALSGIDTKLGKLFQYIDFNSTTAIIHGDHGEKIIETMFVEYLYEIKEFFKYLASIPRKILAGVIRKVFKLFRIAYEKLPNFAKHGYNPRAKKPAPFRLFGHGFHIYESALVIPMIISGNNPNLSIDRIISNQVRQIDIFPTLINLFNLNLNDNGYAIHGQNLTPLIKGENFEELPAYSEACGQTLINKKFWKVGLRTPRYKFICMPYDKNKCEELYDLKNDPYEKKNIIKSQPQVANSLKEQLSKIRKDEIEELKLVGQKMSKEEEEALAERLSNLGYLG